MATKLPPTPHPFKEALAFHRARVAVPDSAVSEIRTEARMRALWAAGLAKQASALEVHRALEEALKNGTTPAQFRADWAKRVAADGGATLPVSRQNLIFDQNIGLAYSGGRMKQLRDPALLKAKPFWMYPLGPDDDRTTEICRLLQGYIAPADSEEWNHIAPPNHYKERHTAPVALSQEEAEARGYQAADGDSDRSYPVIDGRQILPATGFDAPPELLATDAQNLLDEFSSLLEEQDAKLPADYDLTALEDIPAAEQIEFEPAIADDTEAGWESFRELMGIPDELSSTFAEDVFGDGVVVNRGTFDTLFGADDTRELASALEPLLEDPLEVWFVPVTTEAGTVMVKRYIGVFTDGENEYWMWADQTPQGWIATGGVGSADEVEAKRKGYLALARTPRQGAKKAA
jgi:hypothetical protein